MDENGHAVIPRVAVIPWVVGSVVALVTGVVSYGHGAITTDSITYIAAAESLHSGAGLSTWLESPLVTFPPLWPILISAGMYTGASAEQVALVLIALSLLLIPPLVYAIMRRCTDSPVMTWCAVVGASTSPIVLTWVFGSLSELPFIACVLLTVHLALGSLEHGNRRLWAASAVSALAPLLRYAGVGVPLALAVWVVLTGRGRHRYLHGIMSLAVGLGPFVVVVARNMGLVDAPFGVREQSRLSLLSVLGQCLQGLGRTALWGLDAGPAWFKGFVGSVFLIAGVASVMTTARRNGWSGAAPRIPRRNEDVTDDGYPAPDYSSRLLLGGISAAQLVVMVWSRSRVEFDNLGPRLLAPSAVPLIMLVLALLGDLTRRFPTKRLLAVFAVGCWCCIGVVLSVRFAAKDEARGYDQPVYVEIRNSELLGTLPDDCRWDRSLTTPEDPDCLLMANEPWLWFRSDFHPQISPRNFEPAADADLAAIDRTTRSGRRVFILWTTVNEPKHYLLTPDRMSDHMTMRTTGHSDHLQVYEVEGGS